MTLQEFMDAWRAIVAERQWTESRQIDALIATVLTVQSLLSDKEPNVDFDRSFLEIVASLPPNPDALN